jgi:four helix bundle protein
MYSFEKLKVWHQARLLAVLVYQITEPFPGSEKYGLVRQLRRSAVSVCSNIAEGSTRKSLEDKGRFYEVAYGSLIELLNQLILSNDLGFLSSSDLDEARIMVESVTRMLNALHDSTRVQR